MEYGDRYVKLLWQGNLHHDFNEESKTVDAGSGIPNEACNGSWRSGPGLFKNGGVGAHGFDYRDL
jgi:hypothetical protein